MAVKMKEILLEELNRRADAVMKKIKEREAETEKLEEKAKEIESKFNQKYIVAHNKSIKLQKELDGLDQYYEKQIKALRKTIDELGGNKEITPNTTTELSKEQELLQHISNTKEFRELMNDNVNLDRIDVKFKINERKQILEIKRTKDGLTGELI